ncbi:LysR family transcriptional regulator [Undibacterium sp. Tian12W]|uniref:LysR family transcriptional regulator n=1 Tax=Undibacterium sp. Tian12W TaxID=3413054 RepID=UPI003BF3AE12
MEHQLLAIRAFARVVEAGTFTRAADSLNMPKATLTKLIQALEAHVQVKLLQRTTRRVSVTADGQAYYEKTLRLLNELEDIDMSFSAAQTRPRGNLRIDIGGSLASMVIIPALLGFFVRYPDIHIDLGVSDRHVDMVGDNVDCVIRGGLITDQSFIARKIGQASWVTCASPAYLDKYGIPLHPLDINKNHLVASYLSAHSNRALSMSFSQPGEKIEVNGKRQLGVNESNAHLAAGLAGLGIIQTFAYAAQEHINNGSLVSILDEWQPAPYPFFVVYPPNRHLSNRLRVFIDWLVMHFSSLTN